MQVLGWKSGFSGRKSGWFEQGEGQGGAGGGHVTSPARFALSRGKSSP